MKPFIIFAISLTTSLLLYKVSLVVPWSTQGRMLLRAVSACGLSTHCPIAIQVSVIALKKQKNTVVQH
ncbi:hypothetical protein HanIR_Chr12g0592761 [Helianthus annuus]|nr:hypothetical protein HanIR_Chr12g0592761 [Helianthus annuus]